jgi:hypothetical protein
MVSLAQARQDLPLQKLLNLRTLTTAYCHVILMKKVSFVLHIFTLVNDKKAYFMLLLFWYKQLSYVVSAYL